MRGLTEEEAARRLALHGANILASAKPKSLLRTAFEIMREPMFLLLLACSILYISIGDPAEAAILSLAMAVVIGITIVQQQRTEKTLVALRDLSSPRALVIRDGTRRRIAGRDVVSGDLVVIGEGDRVPADGFVIEAKSLKVDESALTGESVSVLKSVWNQADSMGNPGGDDTPFAFSGTLVVQGSGVMLVHATGARTALGRIGASLRVTGRPPSSLQTDTRRVVTAVAAGSLGISVIVAIGSWQRGSDPLRAVLNGITFAMSTIPEEFPVVLSVFMALGAWRISKNRVLTRQLNAIETLGSATVLCVDKTGTLTENKMSVTRVESPTPAHSLHLVPDDELTRILALACDPGSPDPMDIAGIAFARQRGFSPAGISLVHSWPIERPVLAVACLWDAGTAEESTLACKGAPESVMALCDLDPESAQSIMRRVRDIAARGERVLALARCAVQRGDIRDHLTDYRFHFVGLAGFNDPVKGGVPGAVRECVAAGIRTIMITGDYPVTAMAVANDAGIDTRGGVLTGDEVARLSQPELSAKLRSTCVLARMVPEQKLRVVRSLQQGGDIVCMTGDGVNDAPALKAAHIGIAMGGRGTDVAREASALVLLDDNFTSIVAAICQGRRIYDNLQKAISYIIAIHVPVIGLALLPLILGVPQILWPVHLAFLELVIDPVCSIVFEAEPAEATVMTRPPRPTTSRLFARDVVLTGFFSGLLAMLAVLVMYFSAGRMGEEADHARAVSFAGLLLINVALILSLRDRDQSAWRRILSRSRQRNLAMARVLGIVAALCAIIFYVPAVSSAFHFTAPHASDLLVVVAVASLLFVIFDLIKSQKKEPRFGGSFVVDHTNVTRR